MSRLSADIDLLADGKATGFVRVPHSVHRSAYGWIPIPIVRIRNGEGPSVLMQAGNHGDEWEGQIGLGNLLRSIEPKDIKGRLVILPSAVLHKLVEAVLPRGRLGVFSPLAAQTELIGKKWQRADVEVVGVTMQPGSDDEAVDAAAQKMAALFRL